MRANRENENVVEKAKRILGFRFFSDSKKSDLISELIGKTEKPAPAKTVKSGPRPSIDGLTVNLLRTNPNGLTIPEIVAQVLEARPDKIESEEKDGTITRTTKRRVNGYLRKEKGIKGIVKTERDGFTLYGIPSESEKSENEKSLILLP